jgi:hypothetical protein
MGVSMVKIVGKLLLCVFFCCMIPFLNAGITMSVRTDSGATNQVVVGQPFTIEVVIDDVYGSIQAPKIKGLQGFSHSLNGMYSSTVNGKSTARYTYQVRIDALGSYLIGPAIVTHQQQELVSNQLTISVVKDLGVNAQTQNKTNQAPQHKAFLRLMIDEETVVVGQKMNCSIRFYYQDPSLTLHNIGVAEFAGFDKKEVSKLETGTAEIDGVEYRYAQWRWEMYPTKPGEFIIPAYNAEYDVPAKDNNHMFGGLFMFMGNRVERKRVYSNAVTVKVLPLPHCDKTVHAVGSFERISAEIKPGIAKEGEGMVLTIDIEGNGNLQTVALSPLAMPQSLKYYDSNSTIIPPKHADELPKKRFEFIVQGMQCGECEIPEQLFTYFDVDKNAYVTLRTSPLNVSIMPGAMSIKKEISSTANTFAAPELQERENDIADINITGPWYPVEERKPLPWWAFQILFLMPLLYSMYPFVREKFITLTGNSPRIRRRRAFKTSYKKINQCMQAGDSTKLYTVFVELFQQIDGTSDLRSVTQNSEWNSFFERVTHAAYAKVDNTDNKDTDQLCRMAQEWLKRLEKI